MIRLDRERDLMIKNSWKCIYKDFLAAKHGERETLNYSKGFYMFFS